MVQSGLVRILKKLNKKYYKMKHTKLILGVFCFILMGLILSNCNKDNEIDNEKTLPDCEDSMIGQPVDNTGLTNERCKPSCACLNFTSKNFTPEELNSLQTWQLKNEFDELTENPYNKAVAESNTMVCAMVIENMANKLYSLANFSSQAAATAAGAILTHHDACGLCSTLDDFVVYAGDRDIGDAVRNCGLQNFAQPFDILVSCLQGLGFTKPCAQIWAYNTRNTQANCLQDCIGLDKYHNPDGTLSPCLECDERISGPVFKAVAGRTRRNTGLASSICRFCNEVKPVEHNYPF